MIIKRKSLIVTFLSSIIIFLVLVLTLIGYLIYIELKGEELKRPYAALLQKANAKVYSKYVEVQKLEAKIGEAGALKGKPIIQGVIKNKGYKDIVNMAARVKFLDSDGAMIYEVMFHPQEPSLSASSLPQVSIPYLSDRARVAIRMNDNLPFKAIMTNCPREILMALKEKPGYARASGKWSGKLIFEVTSIEF